LTATNRGLNLLCEGDVSSMHTTGTGGDATEAPGAACDNNPVCVLLSPSVLDGGASQLPASDPLRTPGMRLLPGVSPSNAVGALGSCIAWRLSLAFFSSSSCYFSCAAAAALASDLAAALGSDAGPSRATAHAACSSPSLDNPIPRAAGASLDSSSRRYCSSREDRRPIPAVLPVPP